MGKNQDLIKMEYREKSKLLVNIIGTLFVAFFILIIIYGFFVSKIDMNGGFECSTGKLDLDFQSDYLNEFEEVKYRNWNDTYTTQNIYWLPQNLDISGLNNMRCNGYVRLSGSLFNYLVMLGI